MESTKEPIFENLAVQKGSWILVTGVNGYIASHIANQLLQLGYSVRGTVRDQSKSKWIKELFEAKYENCNFELAQVEDAVCSGAFDNAIQGVSGVVHVATIYDGGQDMIERVVDMNRNILTTASQEPTVQRFVYTSSSETAVFSSFLEHDETQPARITTKTWNEIAIERIQGRTCSVAPKEAFDVYAASKTLGEQAIWDWIKDVQPRFKVNTVLPSVCFGASIEPEKQGHASSSGWPAAIFRNEFHRIWPFLKHIIPIGAYFANVEDAALLHVAGLVSPEVEGERLFAFGRPFTWKEIMQILQAMFPGRKFSDMPMECEDRTGNLEIEPAGRAEQLLKSMGKPGWSTLEDTLKANIEDLV